MSPLADSLSEDRDILSLRHFPFVVAGGRDVGLVVLEVGLDFNKALEDGRNLSTGGGVAGTERAIGVAAHQGSGRGPLHGLYSPGADVGLVRSVVQKLVAYC